MKRYKLLSLLLLCLLLTACCGEKEAEAPSAIVYVPQAVPFSSSLDQTESACVSSAALYFLGMVFKDGPSGDGDLSLVRVPLEGGKAEALPGFRPVQLEVDAQYESTGGFLRPGADGTVWLTENVHVSRSGISPVLRQLDSEGNELLLFDSSGLKKHLGAERIYDLWTDGEGTFFANTGDAVVLLDEDWTVQATLEGAPMPSNRFVTLSDGRVGLPSLVKSPEGTVSQLRIIDTVTGDWAQEAFALPFNASCIQTGEGERLFYYTSGDALYTWKQGAEEPERVMSWVESGLDANSLTAFSFLEDGRLAAVTSSGNSYMRKAHLDLLSPTDAASLPERTVLTLAAVDFNLRDSVARFNRESDTCYIQVVDYMPEGSLSSHPERYQQGLQRLITDLTVGNVPDIIQVDLFMPVRRMEAQGILEDLWPRIEADPELGRDALMTRPLEALEYKGGLYRLASSFAFDTVVGRKSVAGDRMSCTYDDFWAALETVPDGAAIANFSSKVLLLDDLIWQEADHFIDWDNYTCRFDGEEFRALLEFCDRFPDERPPHYDFPDVDVCNGEQVLMYAVVQGPDRFQYYMELFGGDASFVGFPNEAGRVGTRFRLDGAKLAITAASKHKEEAWSFLRTFLLPKIEEGAALKVGDMVETFPINRADFERTMKQVMTPVMDTRNGVLQEVHRYGTGSFPGLDATVFIDALTQEEYDQLMALYNAAEGTIDYDRNLINIITEQAGAYFAGDRSLDDTVAAIQSRVGLYLAELQ